MYLVFLSGEEEEEEEYGGEEHVEEEEGGEGDPGAIRVVLRQDTRPAADSAGRGGVTVLQPTAASPGILPTAVSPSTLQPCKDGHGVTFMCFSCLCCCLPQSLCFFVFLCLE